MFTPKTRQKRPQAGRHWPTAIHHPVTVRELLRREASPEEATARARWEVNA